MLKRYLYVAANDQEVDHVKIGVTNNFKTRRRGLGPLKYIAVFQVPYDNAEALESLVIDEFRKYSIPSSKENFIICKEKFLQWVIELAEFNRCHRVL